MMSNSVDRGHKGLTLQRAMHFRGQSVNLIVIYNGQELPAVKMQQQEANRFITAFYDNRVPGVDGIRVAGK